MEWIELPEMISTDDVQEKHRKIDLRTIPPTYRSEWYWDVPFPVEPGIELKLHSGETVILGDWNVHSISSDEGCGCCSGGRYETIVAWRDLRIARD